MGNWVRLDSWRLTSKSKRRRMKIVGGTWLIPVLRNRDRKEVLSRSLKRSNPEAQEEIQVTVVMKVKSEKSYKKKEWSG